MFFLLQNQNRRAEQFLPQNPKFLVALVGVEKWWEKGRKMNMVQTMYTHVCKCKMIPAKTVPGIRGGGDEGEPWMEMNLSVFDTL
jgi:hypothetical protein